MGRLAAGVEYVGTRYCGWQVQHHSPSVQAEVERAIGAVAAHPVKVFAAGRTDTGVHGHGQVIHFDTGAHRRLDGWALGANSHLPPDVSVRWVMPVAETFHARFSARSRRYRYIIHNARARSGLLAERAAWVKYPLDAARMHQAMQVLVGEHDFSAFRGSGCQAKSAVRTVLSGSIRRHGELVVLDISANAFLLHMVRNIAGSLIDIGTGEQPEAWMGELLAGRQRTRAGENAPPGGLYFTGVEYPTEFAIPPAPEFWLP